MLQIEPIYTRTQITDCLTPTALQSSLTALQSLITIKLIDPAAAANTFDYPIDKNLPFELPKGETDPLANSRFIFENGEVDGSDRLLVTEKQDGSGFIGEDGTVYDYATGAQPADSSYSSAYTQEYGE